MTFYLPNLNKNPILNDLNNLANLAYLSSLINKNPNDSVPDYKRYWPVPVTVNNNIYEYQNINKDVNLRKDVTEYYYNELIKWISTDDSYSKHKHFLYSKNIIDNKMKIYKILRKLVKKSSLNWYDLRDKYLLVKNYINNKL